jgi:hypothetical protein
MRDPFVTGTQSLPLLADQIVRFKSHELAGGNLTIGRRSNPFVMWGRYNQYTS